MLNFYHLWIEGASKSKPVWAPYISYSVTLCTPVSRRWFKCLKGVYTMIHVRRTCTSYRCTAYMYHSINTPLACIIVLHDLQQSASFRVSTAECASLQISVNVCDNSTGFSMGPRQILSFPTKLYDTIRERNVQVAASLFNARSRTGVLGVLEAWVSVSRLNL